MAYVKTNWVDNVTPLSAQNLNNLEKQYDEAKADLDAKMHGTTGHKHTGAAGDAPALPNVLRTVSGYYTGDGTAERFINIGVTPKIVMVVDRAGGWASGQDYYGGLAVETRDALNRNGENVVVKGANGFTVYYDNVGDLRMTNVSGNIYHYVVWY